MFEIKRRRTRRIMLGKLPIGGGSPISVQSMCSTDTRDVRATVNQARKLFSVGCEVVRIAVPDKEAAQRLKIIRQKLINIPLVADIHFNPSFALAAIDAGFDGLRINPGNIGSRTKITEVALAATEHGIPIRIGVNAGSLQKELISKYNGPTPIALAESAMTNVRLLEDCGFNNIKISIKSFDIPSTIEAYSILNNKIDYPFHSGITESGTLLSGSVRSGVGVGILIYLGFADTIRISLSADPVYEVISGVKILKSLGLKRRGVDIVSCPTCGRCHGDVIGIARRLEKKLLYISKDIRVAVMGCEVNGPGEASEANIGLALGKGCGLIFRKGKIIKKVPASSMETALMEEVDRLIKK